MRLFNLKFILLAGALFVCFCALSVSAQDKKTESGGAKTKSEKLLPDTTQGAIIVSDVVSITEAFNSSDIGELMSNPDVTAFIEDFREKIHELEDGKGLDIHMTGDEVISAIGGEVAFAVLRPTEEKMAFCLLANVKGSEDAARELLKEAGDQIGAAAIKHHLQGGKTVEEFEENGAKIKGMSLPRERGEIEIVVYSTIHSDWLVASDDKDVIIDLVKRVQGRAAKDAKSLVDDKTYQEIMKRSDTGEDYGRAHIKWFVNPFGLAEAIKLRAKKDVHKQDTIGALKRHGYGAVKGVGGRVGFGTRNYEMLAQSFCYAPPAADGKRFIGAAQALDFSNDGSIDMLPEGWIPANASSYSVMTLDIKNAFEKSIPLIEDLFARKGAIRKGLEGIRDDPQGAEVDIENDILAQLGKKIGLTSNTKLPVNIDSEQLLMTVKIDGDEAKVRTAIDKYMAQQARQGGMEKVEYKTFTLWVVNTKEMREKREKKENEGIEIEFNDPDFIPGIDCAPDPEPSDNDAGKKDEAKDGGPAERRLLTEPLVKTQVFTVAHGHLIITNSTEYTKQLIDAAVDKPEKTMRTQAKFIRVDKELNRLLPNANSMRRFVRLDESSRLTYELMRKGKLPESNSILGSVLKTLMMQEEGERIDLKVDGTLLPEDFDKDVAPFLGSFGWCARTEKDGWLVTGALVSNRNKAEDKDKADDKVLVKADKVDAKVEDKSDSVEDKSDSVEDKSDTVEDKSDTVEDKSDDE